MQILLSMIVVVALLSCSQIQQIADKYQIELQRQKSEREKNEREQQSKQTVRISEQSSSTCKQKSISNTPTSSCEQNSTIQNPTSSKASTFITTLSQQEIKDYLDFHNKARKDVGVPPVQWSNEIAAYAQEWADYLARNNRFEHRADHRYGENIAMHSDNALLNGAKLWYKEKKFYTGSALNSTNWSKAGHYTQMVWRSTQYIGAGKSKNAAGQMIIVGNYDPAGNMMGQKAY